MIRSPFRTLDSGTNEVPRSVAAYKKVRLVGIVEDIPRRRPARSSGAYRSARRRAWRRGGRLGRIA